MSGMPYFLTKGPFFANIESTVLNMSAQELIDWRQFLLDGGAIPEMKPAKDFEVAVPGAKAHLYKDWLGWEQTTSGEWQKPDPLPQQVGWWVDWTGDPDLIIRGTLIEAIEASLGWDTYGTPPQATHADPWPIDFVWSCPHPWMEGWVTWAPGDQTDPTAEGRVQVTLATPGNGEGVTMLDAPLPADGVLPAKSSNPDPIPGNVSKQFPASKAEKNWGMHVVRAPLHERVGMSKTAATPFGVLKVTLGDGIRDAPASGIWVHAPSFADGGVMPNHK